MTVAESRVAVFLFVQLVAFALTVAVARAAQPLGALTQLSGTTGCFTYNGTSEDGAGTCSQARGLAEGESATVSPDGKNVYVGSYANSGASLGPGFAVFTRTASTGALTQLPGVAGCLTSDGSSSAGAGTCTKVRGLIDHPGDGHDLVFTSDGRWAYMAATNSSSITSVLIFQRNPSGGALTQLAGSAGCITTDGSSQDGAGTCQTDSTLNQAAGISISSDNRFLYVTGTGGVSSHRIHVFSRSMTTGALTDIECVSEAPAPVGCGTGRVLGNTQFIALSPDGMHAYAGEYQQGLSVFDRNPTTGLLTQKTGTAGCITNTGNDDTGASTCAIGRDARGTFPILVAPNGATLYSVDGSDRGFAVFHINANGTLTQLSGSSGCVTIDGKDNTGASTCATGRAVKAPYGGAISPDGSTLYVSDDTSTVGGIAVFSLNATTGAATQLSGLQGCVTADGSSNGVGGQCTNGRALSDSYGMSLSPDGRTVYQATNSSANAGLAIYARETAPVCQSTGTTTAIGSSVTVTLRCADGDGDAITRSIVSTAAHGSLSAINNTAGTVRYQPTSGFRGTDSFRFNASDGTNHGPAATVTINVIRPMVARLRVSPSQFSLAGRKAHGRCVKQTKNNVHSPSCRRPIRLRVSFKLNIATIVTFTIKRKAGKRFIKLHGKITIVGKLSANRLTFRGKIGGHTLGRGTYQLIATPRSGKPGKVAFKISP